MGFAVLIEHGLRALATERPRLEQQVGVDAAAAALAAIEHLPSVLLALNELAWQETSRPRDRAVFTVVMSHGMKTDDRLPATGEQLLLGVMDDAYLAFFAARDIDGGVPGVSREQLERCTDAVAAILPVGMADALQRDLQLALDAVDALTPEAD
jgi:hypothetical protein